MFFNWGVVKEEKMDIFDIYFFFKWSAIKENQSATNAP